MANEERDLTVEDAIQRVVEICGQLPARGTRSGYVTVETELSDAAGPAQGYRILASYLFSPGCWTRIEGKGKTLREAVEDVRRDLDRFKAELAESAARDDRRHLHGA